MTPLDSQENETLNAVVQKLSRDVQRWQTKSNFYEEQNAQLEKTVSRLTDALTKALSDVADRHAKNQIIKHWKSVCQNSSKEWERQVQKLNAQINQRDIAIGLFLNQLLIIKVGKAKERTELLIQKLERGPLNAAHFQAAYREGLHVLNSR